MKACYKIVTKTLQYRGNLKLGTAKLPFYNVTSVLVIMRVHCTSADRFMGRFLASVSFCVCFYVGVCLCMYSKLCVCVSVLLPVCVCIFVCVYTYILNVFGESISQSILQV